MGKTKTTFNLILWSYISIICKKLPSEEEVRLYNVPK